MDRRIFDMTNINNDLDNKMNKFDESENNDFCLPSPKDFGEGILTMAFVNMQPIDSVYDIKTAFDNGSLFPNIDKPLDIYGGREKWERKKN